MVRKWQKEAAGSRHERKFVEEEETLNRSLTLFVLGRNGEKRELISEWKERQRTFVK